MSEKISLDSSAVSHIFHNFVTMYYFSCKENLYLSIIKSPPGLFRRLIRSLFLQLSICDSRLLQKRNLQTAQFDKKSISFKRYIF